MRIINELKNIDIEYRHNTLNIEETLLQKKYQLTAYNTYTKKKYILYSSKHLSSTLYIHKQIMKAYSNHDRVFIIDEK